MKFKKPSRSLILSSSAEVGPEDGVDPRTYFRASSGPKNNRKALQMCAQVGRTLSAILAWESGDDLLRELMVESVEPAPDSTHVLVTLSRQSPAKDADNTQILERLKQTSGKFRTEVAAAIHRKRVPTLTFRLLDQGEVNS